jgi:ribonuclease HII
MQMRATTDYSAPTFTEEQGMAARGYRYIAGVDEAGRGALAGPVVAAAVILPRRKPRGRWVQQVTDSKLLSAKTRQYLCQHIMEIAVSLAVGAISHEIIDAQNIVRATRLAMQQAIDGLSPPAEALLIDYLRLPEVALPQKGIVNGDRLCFSISCASIVAKVSRDKMMVDLDGDYPGYGLARHKGYGTPEHLSCLDRLGPSRIHRTSFQPVKSRASR